MAFVPPNPGRNPVSSTRDGLDMFSRVGRSANARDFAKSFSGNVRPLQFGVNPNLNVDINIGGKGNGNGSKNGSSSNKSKRGNRPYKSEGYYPIQDNTPTTFTFNTGIRSSLLVNPFEASDDNYSTLFVLSGSFLSKHSRTSRIHELMNDLIFTGILLKCQRVCGFKIYRDLTNERFYDYVCAISSALQLYYYVDSIVAYCNSPEVRLPNPGMQHLRSKFTADILSKHSLLGEKLKQYPIPPNLLQIIRYMYQNFIFNDDNSSPIIRLGFREVIYSGDNFSLSPEYYDAIISEFSFAENKVAPILMKTFPDMIMSELPPSSSQPIYDKDFLTFWTNSTISYLNVENGSVNYTRYISNTTDKFSYFTFNGDNVDGIYNSFISIFDLKKKCLQQGLWSVINRTERFKAFNKEQASSLLCYNTELSKMITPRSTSALAQSGIFHGVYYSPEKVSNSELAVIPIGCNKVQTSTLELFEQCLSESIYYILDLGKVDEYYTKLVSI
jgi:hypothetical protein